MVVQGIANNKSTTISTQYCYPRAELSGLSLLSHPLIGVEAPDSPTEVLRDSPTKIAKTVCTKHATRNLQSNAIYIHTSYLNTLPMMWLEEV